MPQLERIWIKRAKQGPMDPTDNATMVEGRGIVGNADQGRRRQVTVISAERWKELMAELGADIDPSARRANLLVSGLDLEDSLGKVLRVGDIRLRILGETKPCEQMDAALPGLQEAMKARWGGGCYGEVLDNGSIAVGSSVSWDT